jgi:CheY-like chemotaxis protein
MTNEKKQAVDTNQIYLLVADSSDGDRFSTSRLLQRFGYNVCMANSATEAMSYMLVAVPSVIVAEVGIGIELAAKLKKDVRFSNVPVVILANTADQGVQPRLQNEPFAARLYKPVDAEQFYQAVQAALGNTRRKNIRIATALQATLDGVEERTVSVLSEYGMFFPTKNPRLQSTLVTVDLKIRARTVRIEAEVLYTVGAETSPFMEAGLGLKFMKISPDDHAFIRSYLAEQIK